MKVVIAQVDSMRPNREDGGLGWVLIDDSGPLLIWSVGGAAAELRQSGGCCLMASVGRDRWVKELARRVESP